MNNEFYFQFIQITLDYTIYSIYIINIDNKSIQIGGKRIAIYSCLPTFPRDKNNKEINKIKLSVMKNINYFAVRICLFNIS